MKSGSQKEPPKKGSTSEEVGVHVMESSCVNYCAIEYFISPERCQRAEESLCESSYWSSDQENEEER